MDNINTTEKKGGNMWYGIVAFLITTCVWGFAFVPQKLAMDTGIGPITMNGLRCLLGALCLVPVIMIFDKTKGKKLSFFGDDTPETKKNLLLGGLICGVCLTLASTFQQIGVKYTTVGKSGFLSALYVVIVPLITVFFGKKINWNGWVGVVVALLGMFFLFFDLGDLSNLSVNNGDVYIIICSFFFSFHILSVDRFSPKIDALRHKHAICIVESMEVRGEIFQVNANEVRSQVARGDKKCFFVISESAHKTIFSVASKDRKITLSGLFIVGNLKSFFLSLRKNTRRFAFTR